MANRNDRADHQKGKRAAYERNRRRILATQEVCGICGQPVDKTLPASHPLSATVDHIIPLALGGDPVDINNLQLAHRACNRAKGTKMPSGKKPAQEAVNNRDLPWHYDWMHYKAPDEE